MLDALEALVERLNAGQVLPNQLLAAAVAFFHEWEETSRRAAAGSGRSAELDYHEAARLRLMRIDRALESLERGEAGAAGEFVLGAREYTRHLRMHVQGASASACDRHPAESEFPRPR